MQAKGHYFEFVCLSVLAHRLNTQKIVSVTRNVHKYYKCVVVDHGLNMSSLLPYSRVILEQVQCFNELQTCKIFLFLCLG